MHYLEVLPPARVQLPNSMETLTTALARLMESFFSRPAPPRLACACACALVTPSLYEDVAERPLAKRPLAPARGRGLG
jgi:hypothetical protein